MKRRTAIIVGALVSAPLLLAGCSQPSPGPDGHSSAHDQAHLPPLILTPDQVSGNEIFISADIPLSVTVTGGDETLSAWEGTVADPSIAEFTAGSVKDGASFWPGFAALKAGTTTATLTSPEGTTVTFTLTVVTDNQDVTEPVG